MIKIIDFYEANMIYNTKEISKGFTLITAKTDKFKSETFNVHFIVPLESSPFAEVLLPNVMSQGCKKYPTRRLLRKRLDRLFSSSVSVYLPTFGNYMSVCFSSSYLKNIYAYGDEDIANGTADVLWEMMLEPLVTDGAFDSEYTEREKKNKCDALRGAINNKDSYASNRCFQLMCEGEPVSFLYSTDTEPYENITPRHLYKSYLDMISSCPVRVTYVGENTEFAEELAFKLSERLGKERREFKNVVTRKIPEKIRYFEEKHTVKQARLVIGMRDDVSTPDDIYIKAVFDELYGQSPVSKLFCNVREKLSLCYYCSSGRSHETGIMAVRTGIKAENKDRAYEEILRQLELVKQGDFTDEELENAKRGLANQAASVFDSPDGIAASMFKSSLRGKILCQKEENEKIMAVTKEQVARAADGIAPDTVFFMYGDGAEEDDEN